MDRYIQEFMETLSSVEIWKGKAEKLTDYESGIQILVDKFSDHKKKQTGVFFIGNGGSAAIASHMTADFMKNGGMNTCCLYDMALATCIGNDFGYEYLFSKQVQFLVKSDDLVVAVSSSGNSKNIVNAIHAAKECGASVVSFTGFLPDNRVKQMGDINVYVPCSKYGIIESIHNLILQQIVDTIMERDGTGI